MKKKSEKKIKHKIKKNIYKQTKNKQTMSIKK